MKYKLLVASVALATAQVQAGGFENARLDTSFMYDEGNLVSFGSVRKDFTVNGDNFGTTSSLIGDRNASNLSARYEVNDQLSFGLTSYDSGAIHINYQGAGGNASVNALGPKVDLTADSVALLSNYALSESFSITAGARYDKFKVTNADIFKLTVANAVATATATAAVARGATPAQAAAAGAAAGATAGANAAVASVSSESDIVPVMAVAYEKPDIALRAELLYQGKSYVKMASTCGMAALGQSCSPNSTGGLAEYLTLNFQTGIMEDTLLLASIHKGKWSSSQLSVADTENALFGQVGPTSAFEDSTEYSIGLARRINDSLAVSASYNWEKAGDGTTGSLFTVNDGYRGLTLGVRYTVEDLELSAGYNYTKLGDVTYSSTALGSNRLEGNDVRAIGAKATLRF